MAQHDYNIANQTAPNFRTDLNNVLSAAVSLNSGASAPSTTYANMPWYDTANNILKMRSEADDAWISLFALDQGANTSSPSSYTFASQAQAEAGTNNTLPMSPLRTAQAISALVSSSGLSSSQTFTATGTWTRPANITKVLVVVTGGGSDGTSSVGGHAGGTSIKLIDVSSIPSSTITVGGVGGLSRWADGTNVVEGEGGGGAGASTGGDINIPRTIADSGNNVAGAASWWGGQGTCQPGTTSATGTAAQGYGSGGGGSGSSGTGGAGKQGIVWVLEFL